MKGLIMGVSCYIRWCHFRWVSVFGLVTFLTACAHPIVISPVETSANVQPKTSAAVSLKKVAYVMTDADRNKQVTTEGGGGDKVSYYPYRDLEKVIRSALAQLYTDVVVIKSLSDKSTIEESGVSLVYSMEIFTSSSSTSILTWPPTQFTITLAVSSVDAAGNSVSQFKVSGNGLAEFSEFKSDFGLAGRRAASDLMEKLKQEISSRPSLQ